MNFKNSLRHRRRFDLDVDYKHLERSYDVLATKKRSVAFPARPQLGKEGI
jgi:hypothetical protein